MAGPESEHIYGIQLRESANDGSDFSNGDTDYRVVFLGEDGALHAKDSAGTVTALGGASDAADVTFDPTGLDNTAATDVQAALADFDAAISATGGGSFTMYDTLIAAMSGIVHRWKFDEASGNFADSVGSLTLTKSGTFTYSVAGAPVGGAVTFGASAKAVTSGMGSIPVGGAARTVVAVWKNTSTNQQCIWNYGTWSSTRQYFAVDLNGASSAQVNATAWADDINMTSVPSCDGLWHLGVYTYDGSQTTAFYYDGNRVGRFLGAALNTVDSGTHFQIGLTINSSNQFSGSLDDLAVFNRALQPYEVQQLFNALVGALP